MVNLEEAWKKLKYADFLLSQSSNEYLIAAAKHILNAANIAITVYLGLDKAKVSPTLIQQKLSSMDSPEVKAFSNCYLRLWKLNCNKSEILNAYKEVKAFVKWVRDAKIN